jgi:hypothetical protein
MLAKLELETMGSELGINGRAMLVEEEWASILKTQKRCSKFSTLFRTAWDGKAFRKPAASWAYVVPLRRCATARRA